jgi:hypothetical protein
MVVGFNYEDFRAMKLVDDWKDLWKWSSTHVAALAAVAPAVWVGMPRDIKDAIPAEYMPYIAGAMFFAAFVVARVRKQ